MRLEEVKLSGRRRHSTLLNQVWTLDLAHHALDGGTLFRTLSVIDEGTREALRIECDTPMSSARVVGVMDQLVEVYGRPEAIRLDMGVEWTSALVGWAERQGVRLLFIRPDKLNQIAYIERFIRSFSREVLDARRFDTVNEVQTAANDWLSKYNGFRPHESQRS